MHGRMVWRRTWICISLTFLFSNCVNCDFIINNSEENLKNLSLVFHKWIQKTQTPDTVAIRGVESFTRNLDSPNVTVSDIVKFTRNWKSLVESVLADSSTSQCKRDLIYTFSSLKSEWAIRMFDADAKISSGILEGNIKWPGDYQECSRIHAPADLNSSAGNFNGRYCTSQWILKIINTSIPLTVGICVPSTCDGNEIQSDFTIIRAVIEKIPQLKKIKEVLQLSTVACKPLTRELDNPAIGMIFLLSVFIILVVCGSLLTAYDYFIPLREKHDICYRDKKDSWPQTSENDSKNYASVSKDMVSVEKNGFEGNSDTGDKIALTTDDSINTKIEDKTDGLKFLRTFLKSFCIFTNGSKILNTTISEGQLPYIHGIRFLSMAWVILGHTYAFAAMYIIGNLYETVRAIDHWTFQIILQGTFSVDSFFVLSGFLLAYLFLREMDKRDGKMSLFYWMYFYIHRYWRLTPVYMIALGFDTAITRFLSSGPYWYDDGAESGCMKTWWWNLLYINNFVKADEQCFGWAWYLANDMQFYIISPIFLYSLWRWKYVGFTVVGLLMGFSWLSSFLITYEYDLLSGYYGITHASSLADYMNRMSNYFMKMYIKPYTRIGPYLIGVILGYMLYKTGNKKNFLRPWEKALCWIISTTIVLVVMFAPYHSNPDVIASSFSNAFSRSAFALGLAWVIYACQTGHAVLINRILSYKLFIPLSRLTYCAYLVHPIIMAVVYLSYAQTLSFSHLIMVLLFFGFLVASYGIALITSLTFESPLMGIEKLIMKRI